jgi:hypothetical protein
MRLFGTPSSIGLLAQWLFVLTLALWVVPGWAQVYRCGNAYSSKPCTGGREVDTSPAVIDHADGDGRTITTLYLCEGYGGDQFWTRDHCRRRNAHIERMETVPADLPFEQQVQMAQAQRDRAAAKLDPLAIPAPRLPSAAVSNSRQAQCETLEARIKYLDRLAWSEAARRRWIGLRTNARRPGTDSFASDADRVR